MSTTTAIIAISSIILAWGIVLSNNRGFTRGRLVIIGVGHFVLIFTYILLSGLDQQSVINLLGFVSTPLITAFTYRWAEHHSMKNHGRSFQLHLDDKALRFFGIEHEEKYNLSDDVFSTLMILCTMVWGPIATYLIRLTGI